MDCRAGTAFCVCSCSSIGLTCARISVNIKKVSEMKKEVMLLTGAGQIGMAIARRMGYGMKIVVGDKRMENAQAVADTMNRAGWQVEAVEKNAGARVFAKEHFGLEVKPDTALKDFEPGSFDVNT